MLKTNSAADVAVTGLVKVDAGDGVALDIPTTIQARLAVLEYDTGWRDISSTVPGYVSGNLRIRRRANTVWLQSGELIAADQANSWNYYASLIPAGFRVDLPGFVFWPAAMQTSVDASGPFRIDRFGHVTVYGSQGGKRLRGTWHWTTADPLPSSLPGTPV